MITTAIYELVETQSTQILKHEKKFKKIAFKNNKTRSESKK